ncbi:MAG: MarR family transcriptional regulator [Vicingaceae bacterium]
MKIEEEIKQNKFEDEYQKLMINQLFTGKWVTEIIADHLKPYGLTSQQYNVLRILRGQHPQAISVNSITIRMIDKMSNVSRLVDKLKTKGFVNRRVNHDDRRQVDIEITEEGLKLLNQIDKKQPEVKQKFQNLNPEEAKQLNDLLDKLRGQ